MPAEDPDQRLDAQGIRAAGVSGNEAIFFAAEQGRLGLSFIAQAWLIS
jgi:hypothetical protein